MRVINFIAALLALSMLAACAGTATVTESEGRERLSAELPAPITERYPVRMPAAQNSVKAMPQRAAFNCSDQQVSTLLDELPNLDVSFIEADVRDALLELSLMTGVTIINDDSIEGLVSINFVDKPLEEVLTAVIAPGNFGYKIYDSFIYVGSQSPASPSFHLLSDTCMYKPVFLQPSQVVDMLTPFYQQYVNFQEGHDYLSVVAPPKIQQRIQKDIQIFDQSPPQILLEMSIVEVSDEALDMLGVKWNREVDTGALLQQNGGSTTSLLTLTPTRDSASPVAQALIRSASALSTNEEVVVKATPSMVTLNGKEANFSSTQTSWLSLMGSSGDSRQQNAVTYGVNLRIVPFVSENNQIRLEIKEASVSDLTEDLEDEPRLISHAISTSVLMQHGETLVLGGLLQKKSRNQRNRVPGAERTPLLGGLFRQKENELVDTEVLIVIRPQVMGG